MDYSMSAYEPVELTYDPSEERMNCEGSIDLRDNFAQRNLPDRRHQDTTGWCYAFVAADLASYELGLNISPADIARNYLASANPEHLTSEELHPLAQFQPLGGGFTSEALRLSHEPGFCLEENFPSQDYVQSLAGGLEIVANQVNPQNFGMPSKGGGETDQVVPEICLNEIRLREIFPIATIDRQLSFIQDHQFARILNNISEIGICQQRIPLPTNTNLHFLQRFGIEPHHPQNSSFYAQIDAVMAQQKPISLSIDRNMFSLPINRGFTQYTDSSHQVILAGRRFNAESGRCEYLLRNSEGSCRDYAEEYECENNHVWIPRKIVQMGTVAIDYYESNN